MPFTDEGSEVVVVVVGGGGLQSVVGISTTQARQINSIVRAKMI